MTTSAEANETAESLEKEMKEMKQYIDELDKRIITIICKSSGVVLRASHRWFPFTLSILAVVLNLSALINIGLKYFQAKAQQTKFLYLYNRKEQRRKCLQQHVSPPESPDDLYRDRIKEFEPYLFLGISTIFFVAFTAVVLTGCWKFLNTEGEIGLNLPNNDKCARLCGNTNCISICTEN
ncbi:hypothetical protein RGQ29_018779 [Quercus rubra]|uniref:Uncharacterized protein n=1 Tax=Quercus rubra TaxID=3512 RepID=A0AAN7FTA5_QUERU|nr:hypothetical protein RGQ29_018779 [Quercus rubra]